MSNQLTPTQQDSLRELLAIIYFLPKKAALLYLGSDQFKEYTIPQLREIVEFLEEAKPILRGHVVAREMEAKGREKSTMYMKPKAPKSLAPQYRRR